MLVNKTWTQQYMDLFLMLIWSSQYLTPDQLHHILLTDTRMFTLKASLLNLEKTSVNKESIQKFKAWSPLTIWSYQSLIEDLMLPISPMALILKLNLPASLESLLKILANRVLIPKFTA